MALQHLRSSTANKRPLPGSMSDGQLAVNTEATSPGLFFKNASGSLVKVGPVHVGTTAPNASPAAGGETGNTVGEQWLDTTGGTYVFKVWDGSAWRSETGTFVDVNGDTMTGALGIIAGSAGSPGLFVSGDPNTGIYSPGADQVAVATGGVQRINIEADGDINIDGGGVFYDATNNRLGIDTTNPVSPLQIGSSSSNIYALFDDGVNARFTFLADTTKATIVTATAGSTSIEDLELRSAQHIFSRSGLVESARIDSSGRVLVGTNTDTTGLRFQTEGTDFNTSSLSVRRNQANTGAPCITLAKSRGAATGSYTSVLSGDTIGNIQFSGADGTADRIGAQIIAQVDGTPGASDMPGRLVFFTTPDGSATPLERARITNGGDFLVGKQAANTTDVGCVLGVAGYIYAARDSNVPVVINRLTNDGTLVSLRQDSTEEGSISVSGTTVSYNGAHLSRWSQVPGIDPHDKDARPEILRGTVMSNLDEMCDWIDPESGEPQANEQLNKTKISDVEGDKNVAGVFQGWDDDDDTWVNDFYLAMTGDFVIRIAEGVTVERGDLLTSAGDGTAKPQDDDLIRSSTVAKVTSTTVSHVHPDGSYCVPCVLMAC